MVAELLHELGYSLQANRKTLEGSSHADRDQQFQHINQHVTEFLQQQQPVISVDTKKKELVGNFKNHGAELRPKGDPEPVRVHDSCPELGRAAPYGVYDLASNSGWVSVGVDHDTSAFAVETFAVGGTEWGNNPTRKQPSFSSPPTPVAAMDREYGFGRLNCNGSLMRPD